MVSSTLAKWEMKMCDGEASYGRVVASAEQRRSRGKVFTKAMRSISRRVKIAMKEPAHNLLKASQQLHTLSLFTITFG